MLPTMLLALLTMLHMRPAVPLRIAPASYASTPDCSSMRDLAVLPTRAFLDHVGVTAVGRGPLPAVRSSTHL